MLYLNPKPPLPPTPPVGSLEGNTRSKATYNEVGIYNRLLIQL